MAELKTNAEWIEWGRRDPLFGVASWKGHEAQGDKPWTDAEFYALGDSDWRDFEAHWKRYGYAAGTFAEIGCGAGRITRQLARTFARGHALDVSEDMMRYASSHIDARNVEWHLTQGLRMPLDDNSVDGVFSCHVFQHLPSEEAGRAYFAEIMRTLKPGGTLMIHLPIHMFPVIASQKFVRLCDAEYGLLRKILDLRCEFRRIRMKRGGRPPMHGTSYEQESLYRKMLALGYLKVEFATFPLTSNGALHTFVMATKPLR